ncbi:hypothetical protein INT43_001961 [Umbelopsis isabellina]|uniref:Cytochrome P450 n=1 Tax=Mortierella isabellina TaxID=91625 RepID=A0A8H7PS66_MORIS|nr:hypothetical protein INT43_001961 [Umbelopsis isabellina]
MKLHQQYGHVVRISPKKLLISDKDMITQILAKDDMPKADLYLSFQMDNNPTMHDTIDKAFHKTRRRVVSPAFAIRYLATMEPLMHEKMQIMVDKVTKTIELANANGTKYAEMDLWKLLQHLTLDIIGSTAFGTDFNMIKTGSHPLPDRINSRLKYSSFLIMFPMISRHIPKHMDPYLVSFMTKVIEERITSGKRRQDILQILIDTQKAESVEDRLAIAEMINEVIIYLVAGSETSSNTIGFTIVELLKHPEAMAKLRQEIDDLEFEDEKTLFQHSQLKALPYLNAVISETMRLYPVATAGLQRKTYTDITLAGKLAVPENTTFVCNMFASQTHPDYWHVADKFLPERWLDSAYPEPTLDAYYPFSAGSRGCIGKNFAYQEMRLCIATIFKYFDIKPISLSMEKVKDTRQYVTLTIRGNSFNVHISKRETKH